MFNREYGQKRHNPTADKRRLTQINSATELHLICVNLRPSAVQVFGFRFLSFALIRAHSRLVSWLRFAPGGLLVVQGPVRGHGKRPEKDRKAGVARP